MLGFRDNATLAFTKLRSRRIRLIVTLIVSGLLFTVLVAGSLVTRGVFASLTTFTKDGFSSRFLVAVYPNVRSDANSDPAIIKRADAIQKDLISRKTASAKQLGIPYDPASEPKITTEGGPDSPKQAGLDTSIPAVQQALQELSPTPKLTDTLKSIAKPYGLKAVYSGNRVGGYSDNDFQLIPVVAGKEVSASQSFDPSQDPIATFAYSVQTLDNSLIEPFLLQNTSLTTKIGDPVPILAPADAAEKLAGLKPLSSNATPQEKLQRLKELRQKARNLVFDVCYRNSEEISLVNIAKQQAGEAKASQGKAGYVAPSLQYAAASTPCTPTAIIKDARTADEKQLAAKTGQFKKEFGAEDPQTTLVKFRIVGILPANQLSSSFDLSALVSSIVSSTLGTGWFISDQAASANPVLGKLISTQVQGQSLSQSYVEFNDRAGQKRFLEERNCQPAGNPESDTDPTANCRRDNKFFIQPYGNPMAAVYDSKAGFLKFLGWVLLVLATISAIIMMGTVGKIIADSRKETSVFRAVGAKRLDIAQVYLLYAGILASQAFLISLAFGLIIALVLEVRFSPTLSVSAVLAFNSTNANQAFHLIALNPLDLLGIYVFAVLTGLLSAALPLLTNIRRNPIKDMREE